jgi:hypothetical protein
MKKKLFVCLLVSSCAFAQINATAANAAQQGFLDAITDAGGDDTYVGCPTVPILAYGTGLRCKALPVHSQYRGCHGKCLLARSQEH